MTKQASPRQKLPLNHPDRCAWSLDEWMRMWDLGRNSTYRLIAEGTLPTVKVGRRRLVTVEGNMQFRKNIGAESAA